MIARLRTTLRPQNALETVFAMVLALVSALLFACLIGLISSLVRLSDGEEEMFKTQTDYLQHYTRHHQLPSDLVQRITAYYRLISSNPRSLPTSSAEMRVCTMWGQRCLLSARRWLP